MDHNKYDAQLRVRQIVDSVTDPSQIETCFRMLGNYVNLYGEENSYDGIAMSLRIQINLKKETLIKQVNNI